MLYGFARQLVRRATMERHPVRLTLATFPKESLFSWPKNRNAKAFIVTFFRFISLSPLAVSFRVPPFHKSAPLLPPLSPIGHCCIAKRRNQKQSGVRAERIATEVEPERWYSREYVSPRTRCELRVDWLWNRVLYPVSPSAFYTTKLPFPQVWVEPCDVSYTLEIGRVILFSLVSGILPAKVLASFGHRDLDVPNLLKKSGNNQERVDWVKWSTESYVTSKCSHTFNNN